MNEILIQPLIELEEYDNQQPIENIMESLKQANHNTDFLKDIEQGLKTSSNYSKQSL